MSSVTAQSKLSRTEILTQITGQKEFSDRLTPQVMFALALTAVLAGVAYADGNLEDREKQYLQKVLKQFISPGSSLGKMVTSMLQGMRQHKIYARLDAITYLASPLSISEKLIVLGFGHRLAVADGHAEAQERRYLETIASNIGVPEQQTNALFSCLDGDQSKVSSEDIEELRWLLDPQRFQAIDTAIVKAAHFFSHKFLAQPQNSLSPVNRQLSYAKLEKFRGYQEQLGSICDDLLQVLKTEGECSIFPSVLKEEVQQLAQKIQSQKFRLAVVGSFSQGKSTFLNALLGEELQPVSVLPCTGALTVLKYGTKTQVVCHYKDGTQAVIPFEQYQEHASISEEEAEGDKNQKTAGSNIAEIVLEHPGLSLCRHHVEIVDSPGLDEHSDRTAITEKLLKDADAAIFLTNASRVMGEKERGLLEELKIHLQGEISKEPADNLFVLVNFMDLLRSPKEIAQVTKRVKNIVRNPAEPLVNDDNRVHFVSARSALEATLTQTPNEYSKPFDEFVSALETFLVEERGELELKKGIADAQKLISVVRQRLEERTNALEGEFILSEAKQYDILEQISEISGFDVKIQTLTKSLIDKALSEVDDSWNQLLNGISARLIEGMEYWNTIHKGKEEIIKDYAKKFVDNLSTEIDSWLSESAEVNLSPKVKILEQEVIRHLAAIKHDLQSIDESTGTGLYKQFELSGLGVDFDFHSRLDPDTVKDPTSFLEGIGLFSGGALAVGGAAFASVTMFPALIVGGLVGGIVTLLSRTTEEMKQELKLEVFNKGIDKFIESSEPFLDKVVENIEVTFEKKARDFHKVAGVSISALCNQLTQQEDILRKTSAQKETESALVREKEIQLQAIETAITNLAKTALS